MIFEIDGLSGLATHIQSLLYKQEDIQITIEGAYHFQARVQATTINMNQFGITKLVVETGDLMPSGKKYKRPSKRK